MNLGVVGRIALRNPASQGEPVELIPLAKPGRHEFSFTKDLASPQDGEDPKKGLSRVAQRQELVSVGIRATTQRVPYSADRSRRQPVGSPVQYGEQRRATYEASRGLA